MEALLTFNCHTPLGWVEIEGHSQGVTALRFIEKPKSETCKSVDLPPIFDFFIEELQAYFKGDLKNFTTKLDLKGTAFQQEVWQSLLQIPYGTTCTYRELATRLNRIKGVRAVAAAIGRNPVLLAVPCHRVIGSDGSLTGYAGGIERKQSLLKHEKAIKQYSLF